MRSIVIVGVCVAVSLAGQSAAQEPITSLSLDEAVRLALRENPAVRAKEFERQAVAANEMTAGLRPNPTTILLGAAPGGSAEHSPYTFTVGQPIELGGKRQRRIESAKAATRVTSYELEDLKRQTVYQVKKSFTDVLVAREALALAGENVRALDEIERVQRCRAEKGDISELDLIRIQVERFAFERDAFRRPAGARRREDRAEDDQRVRVGRRNLRRLGNLTYPD